MPLYILYELDRNFFLAMLDSTFKFMDNTSSGHVNYMEADAMYCAYA